MAVLRNTKKGKTQDQVYTTLDCLHVSHYVNPRGVGTINTISRAELAAIAAVIIHGCSHIATDSLTSMHQIKKQLLHPNLQSPERDAIGQVPPAGGQCPLCET